MKPGDRRWRERWADVLDFHERAGRWPKYNSSDLEEKSQARWLNHQRQQHRKQRLSPEREAMMRAAGFRFTKYRRVRAEE